MKHDSFLSRTAQVKNFKYLLQNSLPISEAFIVSDNCASQFKSRCVFAEVSRLKVTITKLYNGEKHGKGMADGMFGQLKRVLHNMIKSGTAVVRNAEDAYITL